MCPRLTMLNELIRAGYEVVEIRSDERSIEADLRGPGGGEVRLVFTRADAIRILYHDEAIPRPPPGPRRPSRFLVTAPLR